MAAAVGLGAFGAHALKASLTAAQLTTWQTGNFYHSVHGLGLLLVGVLMLQKPALTQLRWVGVMILLGILLFSGSLYLLALTAHKWLGAITPLGGVSFIAAWVLLGFIVYRHIHSQQ